MQWKVIIPKDGQYRIRSKFAFLPITDPISHTRFWLERVWISEKFYRTQAYVGGWWIIRFVSNDKKEVIKDGPNY